MFILSKYFKFINSHHIIAEEPIKAMEDIDLWPEKQREDFLAVSCNRTLQYANIIQDLAKQHNVKYKCITDPVSSVVKNFDVVYMTRIQDEHGGIGEVKADYLFTLDDLNKMNKSSILMHPMPKREEIDPRIDFIHRDPRVMYWRQQRNGMWVRAAIFAHLFDKSENILND